MLDPGHLLDSNFIYIDFVCIYILGDLERLK